MPPHTSGRVRARRQADPGPALARPRPYRRDKLDDLITLQVGPTQPDEGEMLTLEPLNLYM